MKIILDSGTEIIVAKQNYTATLAAALAHKEEFVEKPVKTRRPKFHKILGNKPWTPEEDKILQDYPRMTKPVINDLAKRFFRTPMAVTQRYYKVGYQRN